MREECVSVSVIGIARATTRGIGINREKGARAYRVASLLRELLVEHPVPVGLLEALLAHGGATEDDALGHALRASRRSQSERCEIRAGDARNDDCGGQDDSSTARSRRTATTRNPTAKRARASVRDTRRPPFTRPPKRDNAHRS